MRASLFWRIVCVYFYGLIMYIVVIAWLYVVLMMSITEHTVVAGIMTFLLYGVLPLSIILYVTGSPQRRRRKQEEEKARRANSLSSTASEPQSQGLPEDN
jgi:membrane protein implicated in regulation of membrane protease activity